MDERVHNKPGSIITQFRLGLSPLRNDLFKYNIIDNPFCPAYEDSFETLQHYFIECTSCHAHRLILLADILLAFNSVVTDLSQLNLLCDDTILEVITRGAPLDTSYPLLHFVYKLILACVSQCINQARRFQIAI